MMILLKVTQENLDEVVESYMSLFGIVENLALDKEWREREFT